MSLNNLQELSPEGGNDNFVEFKKGQNVQIYKDPNFEEIPESMAIIDKVLMSEKTRSLCLVTLESNDMQVERWIKKEVLE